MNEKPETVVAGSLSIKILSEPGDQINSMIQVKKQKKSSKALGNELEGNINKRKA
jgi:hypothetical protein